MRKQYNIIIIILLLLFMVNAISFTLEEEKTKVVYSKNGELEVKDLVTGHVKKITTGHYDMRPSWSFENDQIVFMRVVRIEKFYQYYKTAIFVVNADGTGLKQISDGDHTDYDPTWTRDGTNRILFSRYFGKYEKNNIYMTTPNSDKKDIELISDRMNSEFLHTCLKDGRILVSSSRNPVAGYYYLLTMKPGFTGRYQLIQIESDIKQYLSNISLNINETKIAFEYIKSNKTFALRNKTLYIADFDINKRIISNVFPISSINPIKNSIILDPKWSFDGSSIYFHSNKTGKRQIYRYNLKDGSTAIIIMNNKYNYEYICYQNTPR